MFKAMPAQKRYINPTRLLIAAKESIHWLENMGGATAQLDDPDPARPYR